MLPCCIHTDLPMGNVIRKQILLVVRSVEMDSIVKYQDKIGSI